MRNDILSRVRAAPTSRFIYSSLSFFGRTQGGSLPGTWFVRTLGALGIPEVAVRQTLYRMERAGALVARRQGRTKHYAASASTDAVIDAGTAKLLDPPPGDWDGDWTVVHVHFEREDRVGRDQLRDILMVEGFAMLGPGTYLHPRDRGARILEAARAHGLDEVLTVFRGRLMGTKSPAEIVASAWDLPKLARQYRGFLRRYARWANSTQRQRPVEALALRFSVVFDYLEIAWSDPELPPDLLPQGWPGTEARALAASLYRDLLPGALVFARSMLAPPP
jgi:phenylacetic acid degradation operon negative regulatory protein